MSATRHARVREIESDMKTSDEPSIAVTGLAAMGSALARNIASTGRPVVVHNRTTERARELVDRYGSENLVMVEELDELVQRLEPPRAVICMVKSGRPVDDVIDSLLDLLEPGDLIVDGGNSDFRDTERRAARVHDRGIGYLGMGVSGGEEGALHGPSLMPGGHRWAFDLLEPALVAIAARADGEPCCAYLGEGGAGHYVKMVHNGIEYADMAAIAECVELLRRRCDTLDEVAEIVDSWADGELDSFLLEITAHILRVPDDLADDGVPLLERVSDRAEQKGTGRLTAQEALELGEPATTIAEASMHRTLSSLTDRRSAARAATPASLTRAGSSTGVADPDAVASALLGTRLVALAQGFDLLDAARHEHGWQLDLGDIARVWRAGCIIRSALLVDVAAAISGGSPHLLEDHRIAERLAAADTGWRETLCAAIGTGVPVPVTSAALAWLDAFRSERLPMALIQAQRDLFGAHTYERTDRDGTFHSSWTPRPNRSGSQTES